MSIWDPIPPTPMPLNWRYESPAYGKFGGIYVVWKQRSLLFAPEVVHVGQSDDVAARIAVHAGLYGFLAHPDRPLQAVWAVVIPTLRNGAERYVGERLHPSGRYPTDPPLPVTLPWLG